MRRVDATLTDHLRSRLEQALAPPASPAPVSPAPGTSTAGSSPSGASPGESSPPEPSRSGPPPRRARPGAEGEQDPPIPPRRARWVADLHEAAIRTVLRPAADVADARSDVGADPEPDPAVGPRALTRSWRRQVTGRHVAVMMSILTVAIILTTVTVLSARDRPDAMAAPQISPVTVDPDGPPGAGGSPVATEPPGSPPTHASAPSPSASPSAPSPSDSVAAGLTVHVAGAVQRPGVVRLSSGARVHDAVTAAGGMRPDAIPGALNLAQPLADGQQVFVSDRVDPPSEVRGGGAGSAAPGPDGGSGGGATGSPATKEPLDLNSATVEQLESLPGVGPVTAAAILAWRDEHGRFSSVDELQEVDGIGPKTYQRLAPLVRV